MSTPKKPNSYLAKAIVAITLVAGVYYVIQHLRTAKKERIIQTALTNLRDSLYTFSYDYFQYDDSQGNAVLRDVTITPDTSLLSKVPAKQRPSALVEAHIGTITMKGVRLGEANGERQIIGDSIIISCPQVKLLGVKSFDKSILIEQEAHTLYKELFNKFGLLKLKYAQIDSFSLYSQSMATGNPNFRIINAHISLEDVLIDDESQNDTTRIFFCKEAAFKVDSFVGFNNNREELTLQNIRFTGRDKSVEIERVLLNYFKGGKDTGNLFLDASALEIIGVNTNEVIQRKNLRVDSILCKAIKVFELPKEKVFTSGKIKIEQDETDEDTVTGFRNAYSVQLAHLGLPAVTFVPLEKSSLEIGTVSLIINGVNSDKVGDMEKNPLRNIEEVDLSIRSMKIKPRNQFYNYGFKDLNVNSVKRKLTIARVHILPVLSEKAFADSFMYQKDRFDVRAKDISIEGIGVEELFENKLIADKMTAGSVQAGISRDPDKPLEQISRVGNYPSQMLLDLDIPVNVREIVLPSCDVSYTERRSRRRRTGTVRFVNTSLHATNITNIEELIRRDSKLQVNYSSKIQNSVPIEGEFVFDLKSEDGKFTASGTMGAFDARSLNSISVPLALIRLKTGYVDKMNFNFKGDDLHAEGNFLMAYRNMKLEVLRQKENDEVAKRRGLVSLLANMLILDSNPIDGNLRKVNVQHNRNIHKSFFNLLWKTIFAGIKKTLER